MTASIVEDSSAVCDPVAGRGGPGQAGITGRTVVVTNFGDDVGAAAHLAALGAGEDGRVVVRPTPGELDLGTLGLDVLVAAGKHPRAAKTEHVTALSWEISRAWLVGRGVSDVVVDRAHRLTERQAVALAEFTAGVGASLWLVWGGRENPAHLHAALETAAGRVVEQIGLWEFRAQLPAAAPELTARPPGGRSWPALPAAEFTTFLAGCRRHLSRAEFTTVAQLYYDTAEATDAWLATRDLPGLEDQVRFAAVLTGWLRDVAIGPAPTPPAALIRLRAVQAALFAHGTVLRWAPAALGPDPAQRLLGDLTGARAGALRAVCRTDTAAATALSLHLNLTPTHFELLRVADVAPDGSAIRAPTTTAGHRPGYAAGSNATLPLATRMLEARISAPHGNDGDVLGWDEFCCREPVLLPTHAWSIFAAHRAYRVGQGATDDDPFFVHPREPGRRSPALSLREAIRRSCHQLRIDPPWIHGDNCRYGADVGLIHRRHGWMIERGVSLLTLDLHYPVHLPQPPHPAPPAQVRPHWTGGPQR